MSDLRDRLQAAVGDTYRLENELGGGGMSRVFVAIESALDRRVVLKVLPPELAAEVSVERFRREIQLAAGLSHPHVVPLLSSGLADGLLFYSMPFVEGETLRAWLNRDRQLSIDAAVTLAREVSDALSYAHGRGIIHRDIKPENILISGGHAVVTDFGIARAVSQATQGSALTSAMVTVGTPAYMSPEQASAERELDGRTDVYSLSCVLYEMLAGNTPFSGPSQQAVIARRLIEPAPRVRASRADVPDWLDDVVARGLATSPSDRFATARDFVAALSGQQAGSTSQRSRANISRTPYRRIVAGIAGLIAVIALGVVAYRWNRSDGQLPLAAPAVAQPTTIAVMPFTNLSADPENAFFADGMTEEVINALSGIEGLRVSARSSVFALKNSNLDARKIGDTLGVGSVLEGSVRRSGNRLRVTAQLVSTADGYQIWSDDFDRELSDVFQVQDEVARAIVSALRVRLIRTAARSSQRERPTGNAEAYDLYLKGRFFLNSQGGQGNTRAMQFFEEALALDPGFARAHAGLSDTYTRLGMIGQAGGRTVVPKAKASALRAIALDSTLAEAHSSLGHILFVYEWNHAEAEREFNKALALDPDDANTHWHFAISLLDQERFAEAEKQFRTAHELEPLLPHTASLLGRYFVSVRQPDSAIVYLREAIDLGPNLDLAYQQLGHAYLQKRQAREALDAFHKAASLSGLRDSAHLVYAYATLGDRRRAEATLEAMLASARGRYLSPVDMATAYAGLGRKDDAFAWLERGLSDRAPFMDNIRIFTGLESLRSDPRFVDLLQKMARVAGQSGGTE